MTAVPATPPASDSLARDALAVLHPAFAGTDTAPAWLLRLLENGLTGVGLFGRNVVSDSQLASLNAQLRDANPEVLISIDEESGDVTRLEVHDGSSFPGSNALGAIDDPELTRTVAAELGRRLAAVGVTVNWAPSADVNSNPANPVIGTRSFGDDPENVARHTAAFVEGLQSAGIAACVKHFPGHGDTDVDSHLALPRIGVDLETLRSRELRPFRAAVAAGSRCVMSAHILVPAIDEELPGTLSPAVLHGLLRAPQSEGGLGFDGLIFTDAMEMDAIAAHWGMERGCVLALTAGADAICVGGAALEEEDLRRLQKALIDAVHAGELSAERLHEAAERCRELGRWTAAARQRTAGTAADPAVGLTAARRALWVTTADGGKPEPLTDAPYVAAFTPASNIAVGSQTPWGLATELRRALPGTTDGVYPPPTGESGAALAQRVLDAAGERRIVSVVRSQHRHPWMSEAVDALLAARPNTIVVEMGLPQAKPSGALHLATHGAARVSGQAAAEILIGRTLA